MSENLLKILPKLEGGQKIDDDTLAKLRRSVKDALTQLLEKKKVREVLYQKCPKDLVPCGDACETDEFEEFGKYGKEDWAKTYDKKGSRCVPPKVRQQAMMEKQRMRKANDQFYMSSPGDGEPKVKYRSQVLKILSQVQDIAGEIKKQQELEELFKENYGQCSQAKTRDACYARTDLNSDNEVVQRCYYTGDMKHMGDIPVGNGENMEAYIGDDDKCKPFSATTGVFKRREMTQQDVDALKYGMKFSNMDTMDDPDPKKKGQSYLNLKTLETTENPKNEFDHEARLRTPTGKTVKIPDFTKKMSDAVTSGTFTQRVKAKETVAEAGLVDALNKTRFGQSLRNLSKIRGLENVRAQIAIQDLDRVAKSNMALIRKIATADKQDLNVTQFNNTVNAPKRFAIALKAAAKDGNLSRNDISQLVSMTNDARWRVFVPQGTLKAGGADLNKDNLDSTVADVQSAWNAFVTQMTIPEFKTDLEKKDLIIPHPVMNFDPDWVHYYKQTGTNKIVDKLKITAQKVTGFIWKMFKKLFGQGNPAEPTTNKSITTGALKTALQTMIKQMMVIEVKAKTLTSDENKSQISKKYAFANPASVALEGDKSLKVYPEFDKENKTNPKIVYKEDAEAVDETKTVLCLNQNLYAIFSGMSQISDAKKKEAQLEMLKQALIRAVNVYVVAGDKKIISDMMFKADAEFAIKEADKTKLREIEQLAKEYIAAGDDKKKKEAVLEKIQKPEEKQRVKNIADRYVKTMEKLEKETYTDEKEMTKTCKINVDKELVGICTQALKTKAAEVANQ